MINKFKNILSKTENTKASIINIINISKLTKLFFLLIISICLIRILFLYFNNVNLYYDEAQYWEWSRHLDFGYYSKPPMIAWVIALFTSLVGDSEFAIRLASPIIHAFTSIIIFLLAKKMFDEKHGFWSGITYFLLPGITISSSLMSTDVVLMFFWSLALYAFWQVLDSRKEIWWLITAIAAGFGMLSKYNMIIFIIPVFIYIYFIKKKPSLLAENNFIYALLLAFIIFLPNLVWNLFNGFVNILHTVDNANLSADSDFSIMPFLEFFGAQFILFGPILMTIYIYLLFKIKSYYKDNNEKTLYLILFSLSFLIFISIFAILSRAHGNWAAPTYIAATILVVHYLISKNIKLLYISNIIHVIIFIGFIGWSLFINYFEIEKNKYNDPFNRMRGWDHFAEQVSIIHNSEYDKYPILTDERKIAAELMYYLRNSNYKIHKWNYKDTIKDFYDMNYNARHKITDKYLFITKKDPKEVNELMQNDYREIRFLLNFEVKLYKSYGDNYYAYFLQKRN